jgi:hypothetical protein
MPKESAVVFAISDLGLIHFRLDAGAGALEPLIVLSDSQYSFALGICDRWCTPSFLP